MKLGKLYNPLSAKQLFFEFGCENLKIGAQEGVQKNSEK